MKSSTLSIVLCLIYADIAMAQAPGIAWIHTYDTGGQDLLQDVYVTVNNDIVACGSANHRPWMIRINPEGDLIWSRVFGPEASATLHAVIETDSLDLFTSGVSNQHPYSALLSDEGELIWERTEDFRAASYACIELKSGSFIVSAFRNSAFLYSLNYQGERDWLQQYDDANRHSLYLYGLRETQDGIIAAGFKFWPNEPKPIWVLKTDFDGEQQWTQEFVIANNQEARGICSTPDGFALCGFLFEQESNCSIFYINNQGELTSHTEVDVQRFSDQERLHGIVRLPGGYVATAGGFTMPCAILFDENGRAVWVRAFDEIAPGNRNGIVNHGLVSLAATNDNELIGAYFATVGEDSAVDGLLLKIEPLALNLTLLEYIPHDTVFSVLPGDTIDFLVRAGYINQGDLAFDWFRNGESVGSDSAYTAIFDSLREELIECHVTLEDQEVSVRWNISVVPIYISDWTPDSLSLIVNRRDVINFNVRVRSVNEGVAYRWILTDMVDNSSADVGMSDSVTIQFNRPRAYQLTGDASLDRDACQVIWSIDVRSIILNWSPVELTLSAPVDSTLRFELTPANQDSGAVRFLWTVDGNSVSDSTFLQTDQLTIGLHLIAGFLFEGAESDSVAWSVNILEPDWIRDGGYSQAALTLNASPNPFNSATRVRCSCPQFSEAELSLVDITGREIWTRDFGVGSEGIFETPIDGLKLAVGVYFLRLSSKGDNRYLKIVCLK